MIIDTARDLDTKGESRGDEEQDWKETPTVYKSATSDKGSINLHHAKSTHSRSNSKATSRHSNLSSANRQEAAAEVAANEATLEVLLEQERQIEELQRLEAEAAHLRAKQEAENAERQRALEAKRRQVERLETIKKLKAAKARQQVYDQTVTQPKQDDSTAALVRVFAESISASRLPVPEPTTFNGDPLRFNDWKVSFQTLIDRKNIPAEEKIYYLQKYVGGTAKKAVESYFLLGTGSAYCAAWAILEERYGNPFLIAKAFRDKLDAWPRVSSKGSVELQELADFLRSCEAAMTQIRGLEVLNDCTRTRKSLLNFDWLTSRWNRKVIEVEEQSHMFPSFSQFVKFLTREAKIACNPVTSLHALKPSESEKIKVFKSRGHGAKRRQRHGLILNTADEIAPQQSCDVGLLIGYNCPQALVPRQVVCGEENQPFAQRTDLGWSVVGYGNLCLDYGYAIGVSHQVIVKQVMPGLQSSSNLTNEVHYVCRTQIKEVVLPADVIKVLESDFVERASEDSHMSQEDLRFLSKMEKGIRLKDDGHYEMPLPFKKERPNLPDNQVCAIQRLRCLERKLRRNEQYHKDYKTFVNETITRGDAERVPEKDISKAPAWYIPHHGVYHPQKPGKIHVVFDCSARFKETSLNDHLLTGPGLTNSLVGVLCRFRRGPVAIMCDIERMFHQFHVKAEDQDYLRFMWWEDGDLEAQPSIYQMKVHLFGAASSPGCANYGLKHIAAEGRGDFSEDTIKFINKNFYIDDGLSSVASKGQAIQLVKEARELCSTGKLRLHKFISNSNEVLATIPKEECAEAAKDLDMALGELHMERALGVQWCIASDEFQFRVVVKENPLTRRGVLSTVASVYDPLGFVAPFILLGKKILQQMCRDKLSWDDDLPDDLRPLWEFWLQDLQNLAGVKIK
ncbi:hypothetical protein SKAU_G00064090 [Synaphobranchus kaupii]|uniref:Uncharacterized protein n=1 Tax=Synaphobranchus kaupii TaxID=118154 RepID=A0A9Q1G5G4_SYNKA|nr:hypothetical protein SKAU_G00064090 [Synaphobranchus kaupii]